MGMMTVETLDNIYELCYWLELAGMGVMCALSARRALTRRGPWPYLTGAFFCIGLALLFYLSVWLLVEYPYVLSAGDLSYLGGLVFLATANIQIAASWPPGERGRPLAVLLSLPLPLLTAGVYVVCIRIYPEILINYLTYLPPLLWLGYSASRHLLADIRAGDRAAGAYHLALVAMVLCHLGVDYFSTLGFTDYALQETIVNALLMLVTLSLYPLAVRRYGP